MQALLISDIHNSYKALAGITEVLRRNTNIKALIFAGDAVDMGEPVSFVDEFIWVIEQNDIELLWVPGNNDFGRAYHKLNAKYKSLEGRIIEYGGQCFTGVGGSPASWSGQYQGERSVDKKEIAGTIFVSHVPPPGLANFQKFDKTNPKSEILNPKPSFAKATGDRQIQNSKFKTQNGRVSDLENLNLDIVSDLDIRISDLQRKIIDFPVVHICGHLHHSWGVGYLGSTKVIKLAAGYLGYYAIMDLKTLHVEFERMWR